MSKEYNYLDEWVRILREIHDDLEEQLKEASKKEELYGPFDDNVPEELRIKVFKLTEQVNTMEETINLVKELDSTCVCCGK